MSPSPQGQSPSPSCVSPSPLDKSPSPSPLDQSPNPSLTKVRVSPDSSPDPAWTHESNSRKVLYSNPTFDFAENFAEWPCILIIGRQH